MKTDKENWMNENCQHAQLLSSNILPMRPDLGFYLSVNNLDISEDFFKEEYDNIREAYFSVIKKLDKHYIAKK